MSIFKDQYIILNIVLLSNNVEIFKLLVSTFKDFYAEVYNNNFDDDAFFKLIFIKYNKKTIAELSYTKCSKAIKCTFANRQVDEIIYPHHIDNTVGCGNLNLIKWLNKDLKLEFSSYAMSIAAEYGYLDIMEYFHNNGMTCQAFTVNLAVENGFLNILKWIREHYPNLFKREREQYNDVAIDSMYASIKGDKLDVFMWFYKNFKQCRAYLKAHLTPCKQQECPACRC